MSILGALGKILGGATVETTAGVVDTAMDAAERLKTMITGELPPEKIQEALMLLNQTQAGINAKEAEHSSIWVSGWRPYIGWICGTSLAFYFLPRFILAAWIWLYTWWVSGELIPYPVGVDGLMELVYALLGIATLRTLEKGAKVAR